MTEPDEALLWARERAAKWQDEGGGLAGPSYRKGNLDGLLGEEGEGYRAGAAASAARIKALEEALWGALPHLEKCFTHHAWHTERPFEPHYIVNIRALLKEGDQ